MSNDTPENSAYASFVESELKAERDRKVALDTRGGGLVTSSGAILAVLIGVTSLGRPADIEIPECLGSLLVLALVAFLAAALAGICAQWNRQYEVMNISGLTLLVDNLWGESAGDSMRRVGADRLRTIESIRRRNSQKEVALRWGYGFQIAAVALLAPVAFIIVIAS